jgi:hypothetical protein
VGKDKWKHFQRSRRKANYKERRVMEERWLKKYGKLGNIWSELLVYVVVASLVTDGYYYW